MKRYLLIFLLVMVAVVLVACGGEDTSSKDSTNDAGDSGSKSAEKYIFKSTVQAPQQAALSQGFDALLDSIEEKSDGRITFERYYSDALVKPADAADAVGSGIADLALLAPSYTPANNPLSTIESLSVMERSMDWNKSFTRFI